MVNSSQKWQRLDNIQIRISLLLGFPMFISGFHCQVLLPHGLLNGLLRWLTYKARFSQQALTMVTCSFQNLLRFKLMRENIHVNILIKKTFTYSYSWILLGLKKYTYGAFLFMVKLRCNMTETLKGCYRDSKKRANSSPCQFELSEIDFMNRLLCARGIGPGNVKIEAVTKARRPKPFQGWSFLGLEDLFAWFVSGLAIKSEPLGKLTRYIEIFFLGTETREIVQKVKREHFYKCENCRLYRHWSENTICYRRRSWRRLTTNSE